MPRALYIHWPFCLKKCPYCDFNSHVRDGVDHAQWQSALIADMRYEADQSDRAPLTSIFFGGGTPSLMPPALVAELLAEAERLWGFDPAIEITLEANPSSVESARFADLAVAGINRVSLGLQALDDAALQFLGRLHDAKEGLTALEVAQRHFARTSFDLIYARPGQSLAAWHAELSRAIALGTDHLSLYQLTIEPGTRFASDHRAGRIALPDDDLAADLFTLTRATTAAHGMPAYEVSNHARAGQESRHNQTYWRYQDYAGIGPGAHGRRWGKLGGMATVRHKKPENWLDAVARNQHGLQEERPLGQAEQASEALLMGLRLAEGVDLSALAERFGYAPDTLCNPLKLTLYTDQGLVWQDGPRIGVTDQGMILLDALLAEIISLTPSPLGEGQRGLANEVSLAAVGWGAAGRDLSS